MTHQEILEKAIKKAIDGGWRGDLLSNLNVKAYEKGQILEVVNDLGEQWSSEEIIYNKAFAKALWGEEPDHHDCSADGTLTYGKEGEPNGMLSQHLYNWQYHLQQMVVTEDPIKYLAENI